MQSQGTDVYSLGDNLLLKAAEYTAKYNLGYDVPYDPKFYRCEAILINGPWAVPSNISRGVAKPPPKVWDVSCVFYDTLRFPGTCTDLDVDSILPICCQTRTSRSLYDQDEGHDQWPRR